MLMVYYFGRKVHLKKVGEVSLVYQREIFFIHQEWAGRRGVQVYEERSRRNTSL